MGMETFKSVDAYIDNKTDWSVALSTLRQIIHQTELEESIKWGMPAYTIDKKNVVALSAFKSYVGLWFHQGVFLKDDAKKLVNAQEKTKAMRQWRFHSIQEVNENKDLILSYLEEAIENQKLGKEIKSERKKKELIIPNEMKNRFMVNKAFERDFEVLTLGKRREYADYISAAKRLETKESRLDKIIPMIKNGIGLNDKYK